MITAQPRTPLTGTHAVKDADQVMANNSVVLMDETDMQIPVRNGEIWSVKYTLFFSATTVADMKLTIVGPAGSTGVWGKQGTGAGGTYTPGRAALGTTQVVDGAAGFATIDALVHAGTDGVIKLQAAQNTAEVSDTKILADSYARGHVI